MGRETFQHPRYGVPAGKLLPKGYSSSLHTVARTAKFTTSECGVRCCLYELTYTRFSSRIEYSRMPHFRPRTSVEKKSEEILFLGGYLCQHDDELRSSLSLYRCMHATRRYRSECARTSVAVGLASSSCQAAIMGVASVAADSGSSMMLLLWIRTAVRRGCLRCLRRHLLQRLS